MKNKNSKLIKNLVVFASGLTLLNFCLYKGYSGIAKAKPFKDNKYKATRVYSNELTSEGEISKKYYSFSNISDEEKEAIIFKTPYFENVDGQFERTNYLIPTNLYSDKQINIIKENIDNQEFLFEQDFIIESMFNIDDAPDLNIYKIEKRDNVPEYNAYEVTYLSRKQNNEEYIYVPNEKKDFINNVVFSFTILGSDAIYTAAYASVKIKQKKKTINK